MLKFKVLGVFLALIYSFLLNTINHRDSFFLSGRPFRESQIRKLEEKTQTETLLRGEGAEERSTVMHSEGSPPLIEVISHELPSRNRVEASVGSCKQWFYRGVALERNRVLRN